LNFHSNPLRQSIGTKYKLTYKQAKEFTQRELEQVRDCKTESARRLLLGISR
jgi:hypothetical protein